jgi:hypothetical protein
MVKAVTTKDLRSRNDNDLLEELRKLKVKQLFKII